MTRSKITDIIGLQNSLNPGQRLLGLDVGQKAIGVAVSDSALLIATPVATFKRVGLSADIQALKTLMENRHIGGFVIGLPINMDGNEGPRCQSVRQFAKNIEPAFVLPTLLWDERLSTVAVRRGLIESDLNRSKLEKIIDQEAASFILQGTLDLLKTNKAID